MGWFQRLERGRNTHLVERFTLGRSKIETKKKKLAPQGAGYFNNTDDYLPLIMHSAATRLFLSWDRQAVTMASGQEKEPTENSVDPHCFFWQV